MKTIQLSNITKKESKKEILLHKIDGLESFRNNLPAYFNQDPTNELFLEILHSVSDSIHTLKEQAKKEKEYTFLHTFFFQIHNFIQSSVQNEQISFKYKCNQIKLSNTTLTSLSEPMLLLVETLINHANEYGFFSFHNQLELNVSCMKVDTHLHLELDTNLFTNIVSKTCFSHVKRVLEEYRGLLWISSEEDTVKFSIKVPIQ